MSGWEMTKGSFPIVVIMLKFINQLIAGTIVLVGFVNMKVLKHIPFQVILKLF